MTLIMGNMVKLLKEDNTMKLVITTFILALISLPSFAQNDNRGRARPNYNPNNLSDAERRESETFVHEGKSQRVMMQECAGLSESEAKLFQEDQAKAYQQFGDKISEGMKTCAGNGEVKGLGLSPEMAGAVSKMYSMVIGMGGEAFGKLKMKSLDEVAENKTPTEQPATNGEPPADGQPPAAPTEAPATNETAENSENAGEEEEADDTDYCRYVAMGTEIVAMTQQTLSQQQMNSVPLEAEASAQKAALMRVSRGYKERSKNAQTQFMGWGATTVCYGAMMMRPSVSKSAWQNYLKLGAAGFMTVVFKGHVDGFNDAADKTKKIAGLLPGAGDCNPHTDRDCYCSETTTMHHPQYCAPYAHQRAIRDPGVTMRTACITNRAEADPKCACLSDDSCLHTGIDTLFKMDGLAGQVNPAFVGDLRDLSSGLAAGSLNADATNRNITAARNAMRKADEELAKLAPPKSSLNSGEKKEAAFLESQGVPPTLAKAMAITPTKGDFQKSLAAIQSRFNGSVTAKDSSFNASIQDNASSSGLRPKKAAKKQEAAANPFAKFMNKGKGKQSSNGEILHFAQKAQAGAQISNRKESSVFDIISRRYQVSAWRRLELDNNDL